MRIKAPYSPEARPPAQVSRYHVMAGAQALIVICIADGENVERFARFEKHLHKLSLGTLLCVIEPERGKAGLQQVGDILNWVEAKQEFRNLRSVFSRSAEWWGWLWRRRRAIIFS